jgi:hypothetical protein
MMSATKISVTIDEADLSWLKSRAKLVHGGNLSAAVAEAARTLRKQEALRAFLQKEGVAALSPDELATVQAEWRRPVRRPKKPRAA